MKEIGILGSTGSVGKQALEVIKSHSDAILKSSELKELHSPEISILSISGWLKKRGAQ